MSMSDHIKQHAGGKRTFWQKGLVLLENGKTGFFCFLRVGETVKISKICYTF